MKMIKMPYKVRRNVSLSSDDNISFFMFTTIQRSILGEFDINYGEVLC